MCQQIKEEKEEKEKDGGKEEIVNGIYLLIEWRFVNWIVLIYNIPLIFKYVFLLALLALLFHYKFITLIISNTFTLVVLVSI